MSSRSVKAQLVASTSMLCSECKLMCSATVRFRTPKGAASVDELVQLCLQCAVQYDHTAKKIQVVLLHHELCNNGGDFYRFSGGGVQIMKIMVRYISNSGFSIFVFNKYMYRRRI